LPAALLTTVLFGICVEKAKVSRVSVMALSILAPILSLGVFSFFQHYPFKDAPTQVLSVRMDHAPYQGLFTTPTKKAYFNLLSDDITRLSNERGKILFYEHFPAGYLITQMR